MSIVLFLLLFTRVPGTARVLNNIVRACFVLVSRVCIRYSVYLHFNGACPTLLPSQAFNLS